jgi:hypothetical protein
MKRIVFIGIDDTDMPGGPGTGRVARGTAEYLTSLELGNSEGIIRHQLLVDPRIRYTSHNSAKCILFETAKPLADLQAPCARYLKDNFQVGSDPGLCLCEYEQINQSIIDYGRLAQNDYIEKDQAIRLAASTNISLTALGGTNEGIIGALAAVALSAGGNDGRYVQLRGIKEIDGLVTVAQLREATDIASIVDDNGLEIDDNETVDSLGWIRPNRIGSRPVLRLHLVKDLPGDRLWEPIEHKHKIHSA